MKNVITYIKKKNAKNIKIEHIKRINQRQNKNIKYIDKYRTTLKWYEKCYNT